MCKDTLCIPNDGNAVIAYKDRKGKLHLSERAVTEAHNQYDRDEYIGLIKSYLEAQYMGKYSSNYCPIVTVPFDQLSTTTLRYMCIDLKVLKC